MKNSVVISGMNKTHLAQTAQAEYVYIGSDWSEKNRKIIKK